DDPRAPHSPGRSPQPARLGGQAVPRRSSPVRPAGTGRLRATQRGGHPRAAPRRQRVRPLGLSRARRPVPGRPPRGLRRRRGGRRSPDRGRERAMSLVNYIYLSAILFTIGGAVVLLRRNAIIVFMGVELMLNAANLAFVTFARMHGSLDGQAIALFVMAVAAAEV